MTEDHRISNEIRGRYDDDTIVVYQAYSPEIAEPALRAGTFVPEWAPAHSRLSTFDPRHHTGLDDWRRMLATSPVRIQWDPDKNLHLNPLPERAIQIGLAGEAADRYADERITGLADETERAHEIEALVRARRLDEARALLPAERPYPLTADLAVRVNAG